MPTPIDELTVSWTGFAGAPGYTHFYAIPESGVRAAVLALVAVFKTLIPSQVTLTIPNTGKTIDAVNGDMVGSWSEGTTSSQVGLQNGAWASPVGVGVNWQTTTIRYGRLVHGRSFFVPMASAIFDNAGFIVASQLATLNTAVDDYVATTGGNAVIWCREDPDHPGGARPGGVAPIIGGQVPNKPFVLKTRRP